MSSEESTTRRCKVFAGIDPGSGGGIAWIAVRDDGTQKVSTHKMPKTETDLLAVLTEMLSAGNDWHCVVERVASSPQMGVRSAFTFGRGYGALLQCLVCLGIPYEVVQPNRWQAYLGCLSGGNKNVTKARAQGLFPKERVIHATADALLLAEYNRRKSGEHNGRKSPTLMDVFADADEPDTTDEPVTMDGRTISDLF